MIKPTIIKAALILFLFSACSSSKKTNQISSNVVEVDHTKLLMAAYQQKAAEYKALCYQAYNIAQLRLDEFVKIESSKPLAIVTDIDETILDNSPNQVHQALLGKGFESKPWYAWTAKADADTIAGALGFFKFAQSKGVEIFYVSNRDLIEHNATLQNLRKFGFPNSDDAHLKLKGTTSSKVPRRDSIALTHTIIMLIGDNLGDMQGSFEKKNIADRIQETDAAHNEFGHRYIVLPNPSYGDWENALFNYKYNYTSAQKDSILKTILRNQ